MRRCRASFWRSIAGYVSGIIQDAVGYRHGTPVITMHMEAYLGAPEPYDEVRVHGMPNLTLRIPGGVPGDIATASIVVNSIPKVLSSRARVADDEGPACSVVLQRALNAGAPIMSSFTHSVPRLRGKYEDDLRAVTFWLRPQVPQP